MSESKTRSEEDPPESEVESVERTAFSELLDRARTGDDRAAAELYRRCAPGVTRAARKRLNRGARRLADTDDLTQSVFADMVRGLPTFRGESEPVFRAWLNQLVRNKIVSRHRRAHGRDGRPREARLVTSVTEALRSLVPSPSDQISTAEEHALVARLLGGLEAGQREVIRLSVDRELSWAEVAEELRLPSADAARKRYARALNTLRTQWKRA